MQSNGGRLDGAGFEIVSTTSIIIGGANGRNRNSTVLDAGSWRMGMWPNEDAQFKFQC